MGKRTRIVETCRIFLALRQMGSFSEGTVIFTKKDLVKKSHPRQKDGRKKSNKLVRNPIGIELYRKEEEMALSVEVAKATGWRLRTFPFTNCRDIPSPPPLEPQIKKLAPGEKTLIELLDENSAYAERTIEKIQTDLKRNKK